jgi:NADP-dependent 3-hydroxy acid dehydrogenase YdfG
MSSTLAGRSVVVTGASSGIGRALARTLVDGGARVVAAARSTEALQALAAELGERLVAVPVDVCDAAAVERLAATAGAVDAVVNNAGVGSIEPFLASDPAQWRRTLDTNLIGALLVARLFLPGMLDAGRGVIINVGSASASGWPYLTLYAASKAALLTASTALDREYAGRGVRGRIPRSRADRGHRVRRALRSGAPAAGTGCVERAGDSVVYRCRHSRDVGCTDPGGARARAARVTAWDCAAQSCPQG